MNGTYPSSYVGNLAPSKKARRRQTIAHHVENRQTLGAKPLTRLKQAACRRTPKAKVARSNRVGSANLFK
jgi:hypothetical protein